MIIIGGGLLGCFAARELSRYRLRTAVLEAREDVCTGISRANSAIIYAGQDTRPGTLKSRYCVHANKNFDRLCAELGVRFARPGGLMACFGEEGYGRLLRKQKKGGQMGIEGLRMLSREEALEMEPLLNPEVYRALWIPSTGTVMPWELGIAAAENGAANGAEYHFCQEVLAISRDGRDFVLQCEKETFRCHALLNCAGLYADAVNRMAGADRYVIRPAAGDYLVLDKGIRTKVNHILFWEKEGKEKSKGMEAVPTVEGNLLLGPTERQDEVCDYRTDGRDLEQLTGDAKQLLPQLDLAVIRSFSAVRPRAFETGEEGEERADCFRVWAPEGIPGFFSMTGIVTPGLTCARELGRDAAGQIAAYLGAEEKKTFSGSRRAPFRFRRLSPEERAQLPPSDKTDLICRCEQVTREEILQAIHANPGAVTLDGIKRRTCAGMGRCQGQRCMTEILKILAEERGVPAERVMKDGPGSWILSGAVKKGV